MRFLIALILLVNLPIWSQTGTISGSVFLSDSDAAAGATVMITGTQKYAIVNQEGGFKFDNLAYGNYALQITSLESVTKDVSIVLDRPVATITIKVEKLNAEQLKEVLIQKTTVKTEILEKGFAVNVIETKEAANRNLQTNDLLDRSVGVRIRQNGGLGARVDYNLNGMSGNSVRIFLDGIPITTYGSSFNLNSIPPALIERIEVYKGVIPAHLADDALGGAINVILKKGVKNIVSASTSYGSFNTFQSNLSATFRQKSGFTLKASGFYNYSDNDYEVWGKFVYNILPNGSQERIRTRRFNDAYKSFGARVEVGYTDVKWADNFMIGYNGSQDYNEIQHGQFMTKPYKGRFTESDAHAVNLSYAKKDLFVKGLEFTFNGVYSQRQEVVNDTVKWNYNWNGELALGLYGEPTLTSDGAQQGAPTINNINRNILSVRSGLTYNLSENHKLIVNSMFNKFDRDDFDELKSALERTFLETRDLQKSVTSVAYESNAFDSKLRSTVFGKYYEQRVEQKDPVLIEENGQTSVIEEVFNNTTTTFGYGLAASYLLRPKMMIVTSAENAVRMPAENEIFGSPGENIIGSSTLKPEISQNLNLGLRGGPYVYKTNHKLSVTASGFLRDTQDKIVRATSSRLNDAIHTLPFENLGKTQSVGFEASADYAYMNRLFVSMNMSRFNTLYKMKFDANGNVLDYYNQQIPNEPFFTVNGSAQYRFKNIIQPNSQLDLFYNIGYVDPFYTLWIEIDNYRTPAQFVQDLGVSYSFPNKQLVASFDARNIFDRQIYDNYAVQKPGRAFYLKLTYTINNF